MRLYPALLLLYGAGIASIVAGKYSTFSSLLTVPKIRPTYGEEYPIVLALHPWSVMDRQEIQRLLPGLERSFIPLSNHLSDILRDPLREILPQDANYQECFDRFEYLSALVHADLRNENDDEIWAPVGLFGYRSRLSHRDTSIMNRIQSDFENSTQIYIDSGDGVPTKQVHSTWPPLRAGLFGGSAERFKLIKQEFDELVTRVSRSRW